MIAKIVLFDDHPIVLNALVEFFSSREDIKVVSQHESIKSLMKYLQYHEADFIIADVITEEELGLTLFETIARQYPNTKVITYSSVTSSIVLDELKKYGVIASVHKRETPEAILDIIMEYKFQSIKNQKNIHSFYLTPKEKEIAQYLLKGLAAKEIAELTNTSVNTINNQKNLLLDKFDCYNSTELVVKLTQLGLINVL